MHLLIFKIQTSVSTKFILKIKEDLCLSKIMNLKLIWNVLLKIEKLKNEIFYQSWSTSIKIETINLLLDTILYEFRNKIIIYIKQI